MVVPLNMPPIDNSKLIDEVVEERQNGVNKEFFNSNKDEWKKRVNDYVHSEGSPEYVDLWPQIECKKGTFQNLYKTPTEDSVHAPILKELRSHELRLCPSCGEAGSPNTLDHYLPISEYPHFSIIPINLFPMCDACQSGKSALTGDLVDPKYFLHPYFDDFMDGQIVKLDIYPPYDTPTFQLGVETSLSSPQKKILNKHIEKLKIAERYKRFFPGFYIKLLRNSKKLRDGGKSVSPFLKVFQLDAEDTSPNSWEHIFYSSVTKNCDLMKYLESGVLPSNL